MSSQQPTATKRVTPNWAHFVAGGTGGMIGALVTCPLEVVKTRLQAKANKSTLQSQFRFGLGTWLSLKTLLAEEGVRGLYRGLVPTLVGVIPARSIYFFSYGTTRSILTTKFDFDKESSLVSFISGTVAGINVVTTTQPIWLIKTRMQLQSRNQELKYINSLDAITKIWKQEGGKAFYRGMSASYLGISESVFQFVLYDKMKVAVQHASDTEKLHPVVYLATASAAKLIAAAATYPHEVIRTRLREVNNTKYTGLISGLKTIAREEGYRGLYGGMGAHLIRVVPNAAIMFLTYEMVLSALSKEVPDVR